MLEYLLNNEVQPQTPEATDYEARRNRMREHLCDPDLQSPAEFWAANPPATKVCWHTFRSILGQPTRELVENAIPGIIWIRLYRTNAVAQAVSLYIYQQTTVGNVLTANDQQMRYATQIKIDIEPLLSCYSQVVKWNDSWTRWIGDASVPTIEYARMVDRPEYTIRKILKITRTQRRPSTDRQMPQKLGHKQFNECENILRNEIENDTKNETPGTRLDNKV